MRRERGKIIISASRRTDIPAFFGDWFMSRLREGFVYVRNPFNYRQVSKVTLSPEVVDCIVFWTKNPEPFMASLQEIEDLGYPFYFQFTLTPYGLNVEPNLPEKNILIDTFLQLSAQIGTNRLIWRYDPILITEKISIDTHLRSFEQMAAQLQGATKRCVISFVDLYAKTKRNTKQLGLTAVKESEMQTLGREMVAIGQKYNLSLFTCAEQVDLSHYGINKAKCIDGQLIETIIGRSLTAKKDKNQRQECGCIESVDIGAYNTCKFGCLYCYANSNKSAVAANTAKHCTQSPLLVGEVRPEDKITLRNQLSLVSIKKDDASYEV